MEVIEALRLLDVRPADGLDATWRLALPDGQLVERTLAPPVDRMTADLVRSVVRRSFPARPLLVADTATVGVRRRAAAGEFDLLETREPRLSVAGQVLSPSGQMRGAEASMQNARAARGRRPWRRWALMRVLAMTGEPLRQRELALAVGATQQAISKTLGSLDVHRAGRDDGFIALRRDRMLDDWCRQYPGPADMAFGWYSLDAPVQQARRAAEEIRRHGATALISGDVAADAMVPWRSPRGALVYQSAPVDLEACGLVAAPREQATLVTIVPRDPTIWATAEWGGMARRGLADPAMVYRDVMRSGGADAEEAAKVLRDHLLSGT